MADDTSLSARGSAPRTIDPLDWEQLLRSELTVEPSPAFLPRVRERVEAEGPASRWYRSVWVPMTAAAAVTVVIALNGMRIIEPVLSPPVPPPVLATAQPIRGIAPPSIEGARAATLVRDRARRTRPAAIAQWLPDEAAVIVDEGQRAALMTLIRVIQDGKLTEESFVRTKPASLEAIREQVKPVEVDAVTVSPIAIDGVLQKER